MRRICTFIPAHTIPGVLTLGTTANTHPPTRVQRHAAGSTRGAATPKQVRAVAEPATARMDSPLAPSA